MTCLTAPGIAICRPSDRFLRCRILRCPSEERRQEMVVRYEEWYGPTVYCCGCGDAWEAGERLPRPFYRYWRRDAVLTHRKLWESATYGPEPVLADFRAVAS
jgi:hypothetical protein